jgi:hypothetical protein
LHRSPGSSSPRHSGAGDESVFFVPLSLLYAKVQNNNQLENYSRKKWIAGTVPISFKNQRKVKNISRFRWILSKEYRISK